MAHTAKPEKEATAAMDAQGPSADVIDLETECLGPREDRPARWLQQREELQRAVDAGYNAAEDVLAFAMLEQIEAIDALIQHQTQSGLPLTVVPIPKERHREHLAAIAALQLRAAYFAQAAAEPTGGKASRVHWAQLGFELDARSEAALLRQVYARIEGPLALPKPPRKKK